MIASRMRRMTDRDTELEHRLQRERETLEHTRAWLAAIVDSSDDAIVSKTLEGIVTSWNPAATRLFGYEPAEIIGKPITTIIPLELHAEEVGILARLRRGERIDHYETVRLAKDGRRIDVSLTISPIRDGKGLIIGASKIARDITHRKHNERLLREADRQKDEFLATLSHELRNPLAPISAAAELLKHAKSLAPELRAATTILERQTRHMRHLVDDLLDMSRITSGRFRLQPEPAAAAAAERAPAPERHSDLAVSRRVLIADDNHDAAVSLSMLLQSLGHDTRVVHDGVEALEEAELFHPEVVLLDIGMPRLDGYETARRIARRPWAAATQIVAVTGWGQETDRQRARESGFHRHLVKPADLDALLQVMSSAPGERPESP
jgi:PAS domain S-box-containing protein